MVPWPASPGPVTYVLSMSFISWGWWGFLSGWKSHSLGAVSMPEEHREKMSCWGIMCRNTRSLWADLWHFPQMSPGTEMTKEASLTLELAPHTFSCHQSTYLLFSFLHKGSKEKGSRLQTVFPKRGLLRTLSPGERVLWSDKFGKCYKFCSPFSQRACYRLLRCTAKGKFSSLFLKYIWSGNIPLTNSNS